MSDALKLRIALWLLLGALFTLPATSAESTEVKALRGPYGQVRLRVEKAPKGREDFALFEVQGYWTAKERFVQMDLTRRTGKGTLAGLFGEKGLKRDTSVIAAGIPFSVEKTYDRLAAEHPEALDVLRAYAEGVNRFLAEAPEQSPALLRFYRELTKDPSYRPARWEPSDSLGVAAALEFYLSSALEQKLLLGAIFHTVLGSDPARLEALVDLRPIEPEFVLGAPKPSGRRPASKRESRVPHLDLKYRWSELGYPFSGPFPAGSNAWAVTPAFAGGRKGYLANDPHLPIFYPATFLETALDSTPAGGTFRVRGMGVPGLPGIFIGNNDHIAWGVTNTLADVDDVYIETLGPDRKSVKFRGQEVPLRTRRYTVEVRMSDGGLSTQNVVTRWVPHHGPVLSDHLPGVLLPPQTVLSYRWVGHEGSPGIAGILRLNRARNFEEFKAALKLWEVGAQNILYADTEGNIGYFAHGRYPVREDPSRIVAPFLPAPGNGSYEWQGYKERVPELYNPSTGRIVSANNDPYGKNAEPRCSDYDDYLSYRFVEGARAKRITELLDSKRGGLDLEAHRKIQGDHVDLVALRFKELLRRALEPDRSVASLTPRAQRLAGQILQWNGSMKRDDRVPLAFLTWIHKYMEEHFSVLAGTGLRRPFLNNYLAVQSLYHRTMDKLGSDRAAVAAKFAATLDATAKLMDGPLARATWGEAHRLDVFPPLYGVLEHAVNAAIPRDGSWFTIDVGGYIVDEGDSMEAFLRPTFYGPNFRVVFELEKGKPIKAMAVTPLGSGGSLDAFSDVQELGMWQRGELRELVEFIP